MCWYGLLFGRQVDASGRDGRNRVGGVDWGRRIDRGNRLDGGRGPDGGGRLEGGSGPDRRGWSDGGGRLDRGSRFDEGGGPDRGSLSDEGGRLDRGSWFNGGGRLDGASRLDEGSRPDRRGRLHKGGRPDRRFVALCASLLSLPLTLDVFAQTGADATNTSRGAVSDVGSDHTAEVQTATATATEPLEEPSAVEERPPHNGFSRHGPWNTKLPPNVPLAPNSAAIVANIAQDQRDTNGAWVLNTDTFSTPIFFVGRNTPVQNWTYSDCQNLPQLAPVIAGSLENVPTPPDLFASLGTDGSTTIYQPSTDTYWDFWRAQKDASGHWSACWGGKIEHYSHNPGIFTNPLGTSASGLPLGAGVIRISELQRGFIDHAIILVVPRTQANCFSWPANRDDGNTVGSDIPCEGQRLRLNPSFDVSSLYGRAAQTIGRAMQQYGLIITDHGGAVVTYAEDERLYEATHGGVNPYPALEDPDNLLTPLEQQAVLTQIPIEQLQALPFNYGEPRRDGN